MNGKVKIEIIEESPYSIAFCVNRFLEKMKSMGNDIIKVDYIRDHTKTNSNLCPDKDFSKIMIVYIDNTLDDRKSSNL